MTVRDLGSTVRDVTPDAVRAWFEAVRDVTGAAPAELFVRVAERVRVGGVDGRGAISRVAERGLAVRAVIGRDGRKGFAATTSI